MENTIIKRRGLSLIEIMIGMSIIAIAFIPIIRGISYGNKSTVKISNYSKVTRVIEKLIEECKFVPFTTYKKEYKELDNNSWFEINQAYFPKSLEAIKQMEKEIKRLKIEPELKLIKTPQNMIREIWIRVRATWEEGDGTTKNKPRELKLVQAIHNPDCN
jgi:prepilin-type N-terminal cleavage/methylation domain-containing protein